MMVRVILLAMEMSLMYVSRVVVSRWYDGKVPVALCAPVCMLRSIPTMSSAGLSSLSNLCPTKV